jgi:hypothetical protein
MIMAGERYVWIVGDKYFLSHDGATEELDEDSLLKAVARDSGMHIYHLNEKPDGSHPEEMMPSYLTHSIRSIESDFRPSATVF